MEQGKANKIFSALLVIFVVWGVYYLYLGFTGAWNNYQLLKEGQKIQGTVIQVGRSPEIGGTPAHFLSGHEVVASFTSPNGQLLSITGYVNILINPVVGNGIVVLYDSKQPELSRIYDPVNIWGRILFFLIVGFALPYSVFKYKWRMKHNPQSLVDIEQKQFDRFQQNTQNVNPKGFLGAQNPHATRNVFILFAIIFGGIILFSLLISALGVK